MKASDVMTPAVISADPDATVLQAARYMLQHQISGLPVIDKTGKLVGILSEGDFLRRRETRTERKRSRWLEFLMGPGKIAAEYTHSHGNKVAEVMTTEVHTVSEDTTLEDIVELMERHRIKRVPVLHGNKVVGIVTRSNLMHAMVSLARTEPKAAKDDSTIREKLLAEMQKEKWAPTAMKDDGVSRQMNSSAMRPISPAISGGATGMATTSLLIFSLFNVAIAAFRVAPVATPSSTRIMVLPSRGAIPFPPR